MKKFICILLIFILGFSFTSCKKKDYHKVMFEITFLQIPATGNSNSIEVYVTPSYADNKPYINRLNVPKVWRYEYIGLEKGQKVLFGVRGQLSYYYEMRVYIDDREVSYLKVKVSDYNYYDAHIEESSGLNTSNYDTGLIEFVY